MYKPPHNIWFIEAKWEWKSEYMIPNKKEFVCIVKNMVEHCEAQHAANSVTILVSPS